MEVALGFPTVRVTVGDWEEEMESVGDRVV